MGAAAAVEHAGGLVVVDADVAQRPIALGAGQIGATPEGLQLGGEAAAEVVHQVVLHQIHRRALGAVLGEIQEGAAAVGAFVGGGDQPPEDHLLLLQHLQGVQHGARLLAAEGLELRVHVALAVAGAGHRLELVLSARHEAQQPQGQAVIRAVGRPGESRHLGGDGVTALQQRLGQCGVGAHPGAVRHPPQIGRGGTALGAQEHRLEVDLRRRVPAYGLQHVADAGVLLREQHEGRRLHRIGTGQGLGVRAPGPGGRRRDHLQRRSHRLPLTSTSMRSKSIQRRAAAVSSGRISSTTSASSSR